VVIFVGWKVCKKKRYYSPVKNITQALAGKFPFLKVGNTIEIHGP